MFKIHAASPLATCQKITALKKIDENDQLMITFKT
jgi:hypothetical protein